MLTAPAARLRKVWPNQRGPLIRRAESDDNADNECTDENDPSPHAALAMISIIRLADLPAAAARPRVERTEEGGDAHCKRGRLTSELTQSARLRCPAWPCGVRLTDVAAASARRRLGGRRPSRTQWRVRRSASSYRSRSSQDCPPARAARLSLWRCRADRSSPSQIFGRTGRHTSPERDCRFRPRRRTPTQSTAQTILGCARTRSKAESRVLRRGTRRTSCVLALRDRTTTRKK